MLVNFKFGLISPSRSHMGPMCVDLGGFCVGQPIWVPPGFITGHMGHRWPRRKPIWAPDTLLTGEEYCDIGT